MNTPSIPAFSAVRRDNTILAKGVVETPAIGYGVEVKDAAIEGTTLVVTAHIVSLGFGALGHAQPQKVDVNFSVCLRDIENFTAEGDITTLKVVVQNPKTPDVTTIYEAKVGRFPGAAC